MWKVEEFLNYLMMVYYKFFVFNHISELDMYVMQLIKKHFLSNLAPMSLSLSHSALMFILLIYP